MNKKCEVTGISVQLSAGFYAALIWLCGSIYMKTENIILLIALFVLFILLIGINPALINTLKVYCKLLYIFIIAVFISIIIPLLIVQFKLSYEFVFLANILIVLGAIMVFLGCARYYTAKNLISIGWDVR